ncbi:MAG: HpcH/HpaI aldolase family protein [Novosphingobium sp.]
MTAFKDRLAAGSPLLGLWQSLASPYTAEICARVGFDWLLFDGEHAPNTLQTLLGQLQAAAPFPVEAIARVPSGEAVAIKHYLDLGFATLLVPMIDSADHARTVVAATRYPPHGVRGVASAVSRAAGFGTKPDYLATAHLGLTVIVQIESRAGLEAIDEIAAVEGVDALFVGPADLAASLGHLGNPGHPEVQLAIAQAKARIDAAGKPAGIFATSPEDARRRGEDGFSFISIGTDIGLLARGAATLLGSVRS